MNPFDKVLFKSPKYSVFDLSHSNKLTHTLGKITPIAYFDMCPGDEIKINLSQVTRTAPMVAPIFDRIRMDVHAFFVPYRIVWHDSEDFFNLSTPAGTRPAMPQVIPYYNSTTYFTSAETPGYKVGQVKGTLADYLGYPNYDNFKKAVIKAIEAGVGGTVGSTANQFDIMKFLPDSYIEGSSSNRENGWDTVSEKSGTTSSTPVSIPFIYNVQSGTINTTPAGSGNALFMTFAFWMFSNTTIRQNARRATLTAVKIRDWGFEGSTVEDLFFWLRENGYFVAPYDTYDYAEMYQKYIEYAYSYLISQNTQFTAVSQFEGSASSPTIRATTAVSALPKRVYHRIIADWYRNSNITDLDTYLNTFVFSDAPAIGVDGSNLQWSLADRLWDSDYFTSAFTSLSNASVPIPVSGTIQDLRNASSTQNVLERALYAGKKYIDQVLAFFGVQSSDARLDRAEVIGVTSFNININEVVQTSQTTNSSNLGDYAGRGLSFGKDTLFHYKAEEHGMVMVVVSTKPDATYTSAVDRLLWKTSPYDFLIPQFANVGEQPISIGEIDPVMPNLYSGSKSNNQVFGYNRRYSEYMFHHSSVHGEFLDSMDFWSMSRQFDTTPALNEEFISINKVDNLNRVFSVPKALDNFYSHFYFDVRCSRPLPRYINYGY